MTSSSSKPGSIADRTSPPISVFCACGAQWHGPSVARAKENIAAHRARGKAHHPVCWLVPHWYFKKRFPCVCEACKTEKAVRRAEKRLGRQIV